MRFERGPHVAAELFEGEIASEDLLEVQGDGVAAVAVDGHWGDYNTGRLGGSDAMGLERT